MKPKTLTLLILAAIVMASIGCEPQDAETLFKKGEYLASAGKYGKAIKAYSTALEIERDKGTSETLDWKKGQIALARGIAYMETVDAKHDHEQLACYDFSDAHYYFAHFSFDHKTGEHPDQVLVNKARPYANKAIYYSDQLGCPPYQSIYTR